MRKARRTDLQAVRLVGAIADDVDAELALGMLDSGVSLAFGHMETFGEQLEVMDQLFHVRLHRLTVRRSHLVVAGDDRAGVDAQPVNALLDDAVGLAHFGNANQVAVIAIAGLADGHVEVHLGVGVVRLLLAQVPGEARAAQHRAGEAEVERTLRRDHAHTHGALLPDAVVGEQGFVLVHQAGELGREVVNEIEQRALAVFVQRFDRLGVLELADLVLRHAVRQVAVNAARPEISRMHARPRYGLVHVKQGFAFAKAVNQDVHGAAVETVRAQPHQVVQQAGDLGVHDADVLRTNRHVHTHHLLDGQAVGLLVGHHRHVVEAVHVRQRLDVGLALGEFFSGAVQQADVWISALNHFTVEFEHKAQHAVRGRVLRPEVERVIFDFSHVLNLDRRCTALLSSVVVFADHARRDLARLDRDRLVNDAFLFRVVTHLDVTGGRKILAERMADETVVGQDAAQVVVTFKDDAEQVKGFALEPVDRVPNLIQRWQHREVVVRAKHLQAHALVQADRQQVRGGAKAQAVVAAVAVFRVVNAAQVEQLLKLATRRVAQDQGRGNVISRLDDDGELAQGDRGTLELVTQCGGNDVLELLGRSRMQWSHQALAMVLVRRIFCCNWMMPYMSASAVGGQPGT